MRVQPIKPVTYKPNLKGIPRPLSKQVREVNRLADVKWLVFYNRSLF